MPNLTGEVDRFREYFLATFGRPMLRVGKKGSDLVSALHAIDAAELNEASADRGSNSGIGRGAVAIVARHAGAAHRALDFDRGGSGTQMTEKVASDLAQAFRDLVPRSPAPENI